MADYYVTITNDEDCYYELTRLSINNIISFSLYNSNDTSSATTTTTTSNIRIQICILLCFFFIISTFIISQITKNYSQVDKIWSITPIIYSWIMIYDKRTFLMAILVTVWGIRLTYNFYRRNGYKTTTTARTTRTTSWLSILWDGEEDYRWKYLQNGFLWSKLQNPYVWTMFNFGFISFFQNLLLLYIVSPSIIVYIIATTKCNNNNNNNNNNNTELNIFDSIITCFFLLFVVGETIADNQQYQFQQEKEKYKIRQQKQRDNTKFVDVDIDQDIQYTKIGFIQSGLFSIVRKPNYSCEQMIWITYYFFSISGSAVINNQIHSFRYFIINWSCIGCVMLILLFQGSGYFTESITISKYPKYKQYMMKTPLYVPNIIQLLLSRKKDKDDNNNNNIDNKQKTKIK